jgi:alkanesulfonate monooxygenase SsuD/methylene tetrahydromethanopterin reductase-like flavin-dependent oxidoreductase (luciferase family)
MKAGLMIGTSGDPGDVADEARRAERLGFDLVTAGEHVFFHGPTANAYLTLAAAAAVTEQVRLLSTLTILPLYPMALAAKMAATLDRISHGRFELGVGVGGEYPPEFAASGVPVAGRGRRADEALEVLLRLLSGEKVTAEGHFGSLQGVQLNPLPVQRPRPPVWVGGRTTPAMRRAGRFADVWMPYMVSPASFARSLSQARAFAVQAQRPATSLAGALFVWGCVDADPGRARRAAVESVSRIYNQDFGPLADRYLLHGDPDMVVARLAEFHAAGADAVIFAAACAPERRADVAALFAEAVLPRLPGHGDRSAIAQQEPSLFQAPEAPPGTSS